MKTILLLFFTIFTVGICAFDVGNGPRSFISIPEKQKGPYQRGMKLLMTNFDKGILKAKKENFRKDYTVFPNRNMKKLVDIPSSPYFPAQDQIEEPKIRVKKVLPEFKLLRKKRSAEDKKADDKKADDKKADDEKTADKDTPPATNGTIVTVKSEKTSVTSASPKKDTTKAKKETKKAAESDGISVKTHEKGGKPQRRGHKSRGGKKSNRKGKHHSARGGRHKSSKKSGKHGTGRKSLDNKNKDARRLISAKDALIENYPYVVSVQKEDEHWCAGAILNQRLVITTANCVWKSNRVSRMRVRAGSRHTDHGGQLVRIAEVMKHPDWSLRKNPDNDVALLLTDANIRFSHSCHSVDLPNQVMMPIFDDAWVTSWGAERRDGFFPKSQAMTLQVYHARLLNREGCNNVTTRYGVVVTENFICLEQLGKRAPCTRDTGAPAVSDGVLWGMASWGIRKMCGTERFPAMFSFTASKSNLAFIRSALVSLMSEQRLDPFPDRFPEAIIARSEVNLTVGTKH